MKKKILAIVMVVAMIFGALTGCTDSSNSNASNTPNTGSSGSSGSTGGNQSQAADNSDRVLRLRLTSSVTSLDWEGSTNTHDMKVWHQMFEGLYGMDEANNGYYQELAKEVELNDDETVYTITLQDGVKFQNGDDLKASDVVFSYNRAMKNPAFNYLTAPIDKVEAADDSTVKITLKYPFSPIGHTFFCIKIMSEREVTEQGDKFGTVLHKAGTGPYYVEEYDVASGVKLRAFEDYWRGAPSIKAIEYRVLSDDSAAVISYENGELDYYEEAPLSDWESLSAAAGENKAMLKGNNILWFGVNYLANDVLANEKVRQAMFYAINKEDINIAVCDGLGEEATQYMPSEYVATSPKDGFETYPYNPEKAKELLTEAGYPDGVNVGTILTCGASTGKNAKMAQVVQANLAEIGITAEVSVMDVSIVVERWHMQDYDLCVFADSGNYDYNNIRQQLHSESVGMYCIKYKDGPFDWQRMEELIELGASVSDVDKRLEYYTELWSITMDTATMLPCLHYPTALVWSKDLNIGEPVPTYYKVRTFSWK